MQKGCLQRSNLQSQQDVPVVLCTEGNWELRSKPPGKQQCSRARGGIGWPGSEGDSGRAMWYLHSNVGAVGGGQQCHLLMAERGNVRLL